MAKLFANSGDPDQLPHFAVSDLSLHCLAITLFGPPDLKCVKRVYDFPTPPFFFFWNTIIIMVLVCYCISSGY